MCPTFGVKFLDIQSVIDRMNRRRQLLKFETLPQDLGWRIAKPPFICPRCGRVMTVRYNLKRRQIEIRCFHPSKHKGCGLMDIFSYDEFPMTKPEPVDVFCKFLDRFGGYNL